jgi:hypothetical protein
MSFSTRSYLAGVGSVIAALTVGFSGGLFMAVPTQYAEQNRLQRVMSSAPIASPAPQTAVAPTPPIAAAPKPETIEAKATSQPAPAIQQPARPEPIPVMAKAVEAAPAMAKAPEPVRAIREQERGAQPNVEAEKIRAPEARAAERKRAEAKKFAERRKQREIELAADTVKRMLRDRNPQQVADGIETPRFGFFGED